MSINRITLRSFSRNRRQECLKGSVRRRIERIPGTPVPNPEQTLKTGDIVRFRASLIPWQFNEPILAYVERFTLNGWESNVGFTFHWLYPKGRGAHQHSTNAYLNSDYVFHNEIHNGDQSGHKTDGRQPQFPNWDIELINRAHVRGMKVAFKPRIKL